MASGSTGADGGKGMSLSKKNSSRKKKQEYDCESIKTRKTGNEFPI